MSIVSITKRGSYTAEQITAENCASDFALFAEYIDPNATTSEAEFNAMTFEARVAFCQQVMDENA